MTSESETYRRVNLQLVPPDGESGEIPMDALATVLRNFSQFTKTLVRYELSTHPELTPAEARELKALCEPKCLPARPGSYEVPVLLAPSSTPGRSGQLQRLVDEHPKTVQRLLRVIDSDDEAFRQVVSDERVRGQLRQSLNALRDAKRTGCQLRMTDHMRKVMFDSNRRRKLELIDDGVAQDGTPLSEQRYCGVLNAIGVRSKYLRVDLLQGNSLRVPYEHFEALRIPVDDDRLLEISGVVKSTCVGKRTLTLQSLHHIAEIDRFDFSRDRFSAGGKEFVVDPPMNFSLTHDREDGIFDLVGDFGIRLHFERATDAGPCLDFALELNWRDYGEVPITTLKTTLARQLHTELRSRVSEKNNA